MPFCERCGKRFVGTAAHGNLYRYRYYTCFSRQRYGTKTCPAERLPADKLESAVLAALLETYSRSDLITQALVAAAERSGAVLARHSAELKAVESELSRTEEAIERYLLAFEAGTMPESQCGSRIAKLDAKASELQSRRSRLNRLLMSAEASAPSQDQLDEVRSKVKEAI